MKKALIWIAACLAIGIGGGLLYINQPKLVEARTTNHLRNATPMPNAKLVTKTFTNAGHTYKLLFFSDSVVTTGDFAKSANQDAVLARPGKTPTSFVVFAKPIDNANANLRSDCATRTPTQVVFTVKLYGSDVSVCRGATAPYSVYTMDVRATGTWEQITLFNSALADQTSYNDQLKTILGSLKID